MELLIVHIVNRVPHIFNQPVIALEIDRDLTVADVLEIDQAAVAGYCIQTVGVG